MLASIEHASPRSSPTFLSQPQLAVACWVAEEGGRLVGYLLAVYLFSLEHGGMMAEIDEFFVLNEKRSLHIGTALLDAASEAMTTRRNYPPAVATEYPKLKRQTLL